MRRGRVELVLGHMREGALQILTALVCFLLAVAFVSPVEAFAVTVAAAVATELGAFQRYRIVTLLIDLAGSAVPSLLAGIAINVAAGGGMQRGSLREITTLALVGVGLLALNLVLVRLPAPRVDRGGLSQPQRYAREILPSLGLALALTLLIVSVYARYGEAIELFMILSIVAFSYVVCLVVIARQRTGQYASLSWGVLSALVRSLDRRDGRTARHSAAVAAFARD
ncbi:MAG TPA: hypothetical protein VF526_04400, partial [Solirubrobacteraceae bacterium]